MLLGRLAEELETFNERLEEVDPGDRPPMLRRYVKVAPGGRAMIGVQPDAPQADFERIAPDYPVFRITTDPAASEVRTTRRLWISNHIVNPIVRRLLRSRFRGRLGRAVALLTYRGPISGGRLSPSRGETSRRAVVSRGRADDPPEAPEET